MNVPDFLIIGAARSGTTALCNSLQQHPQIFFSPLKEPHFLAFCGKSMDFTGPGDDVVINSKAVTDVDSYRRLFDGVSKETAVGEGSVSTLYYHDAAIDNIRKFAPDARMIVVLRNPIQRAFSSFLYMTARGYEPLDDFEQALDDEQRRIDANWHHIWHYTKMGFYSEQLAAFREAFGPDRVQVLLFEDIKNDPQRTMQDLYTYLDVDPEFTADTSVQVNRSGIPRSRVLQYLLHQVGERHRLKQMVKAIVPMKTREWLRRVNLTHPEMPPSARQRLQELFRDEIGQLQQMLNRDLSHWLQ